MTVVPPTLGGYRRFFRIAAPALVLLTISISMALVPADAIVDRIGTGNAYILMFVLGIVGGLSTFIGIPYHVVLMSLAAGGLNPVILGTATALGVIIGDSTMFLIGRQVRSALPPVAQHATEALSGFIDRHPRLLTPILLAYGALSPFSNDFIVASLSVSGYSYTRIIAPLGLGNVVFNVAVAFAGYYAYDVLVGAA